MKKIPSFLADHVIRPCIIFFFSAYHAAFMLAAPVICIRLAFETNSYLKDRFLTLLRTLFPAEISGATILAFLVFFLVASAYCIAALALIVRIPAAIIKWNIARLTGMLYGNWVRALPYLLMMTGPAIYVVTAIALEYDGIKNDVLNGMIITVIGQYGALSLVSLARAARHAIVGARGVTSLLPALAVLFVALPLVALTALTYAAGMDTAGTPNQVLIFHIFLLQSLAGSIAFYWNHYDEFIELLTEDESDDS